MLKIFFYLPVFLILIGAIISCNSTDKLNSTLEVLVTSEGGDKISKKENVVLVDGTPTGTIIKVDPKILKQEKKLL